MKLFIILVISIVLGLAGCSTTVYGVPEEMRMYSETVEIPGVLRDALTETIRIQQIAAVNRSARNMEVTVEDERYTVTFTGVAAVVSDASMVNRQWTQWRSQAEALRKAVYLASFSAPVQTKNEDDGSQYAAVIAEAERNQEVLLPASAQTAVTPVKTGGEGDIERQYRAWERNAAIFYEGYNLTLSRIKNGERGLEYMLMQDERDLLTAQEKMSALQHAR
ncbi:MAG: hypothetical protein LBH75_04710 [Treponema sp.]|jgi:hypothetical protein|nr:hypothetical protein [Treponema sp.]